MRRALRALGATAARAGGPRVVGRPPRGASPFVRGARGPHATQAHEPGRAIFTEEPALDEEEELWTDEGADDHAGWFCVGTDPFPCPAEGCSFVARFMTAAHLILVWEEQDDPNLLRHAQRAKDVGRNPRVVEYRPEFGPSASYYAWEAAGRPVHGIRR